MADRHAPRVSVIIPNYNHAQYLSQRLETVLHQSFQDFEVIYLDDASTDNSSAVFADYSGDSRISVFNNEQNSGSPFKQWNKGFEKATGEFIWIAESDDFSHLDFLKKMVKALDDTPQADLAYCQSWTVTHRNGKVLQSLIEEWYASFDDRDRWKQDYIADGKHEVSRYMIFKNTIPNASAVLFRRSILKDGLRAPEDMRLTGDWMFWSKLLLGTHLVYLSEPLNYFRDAHEGSQRSKTEKHGFEMVEGLEIYNMIDQELELDLELKRRVLFNHVKSWAVLSCSRRLSWSVNRDIYSKILLAHPAAREGITRKVFLPFVFYYISVPLNRIWIVREPYRLIKKIYLYIFGDQSFGMK